MKIQATTQHSPWYSSRRHVAIIGDILWRNVNMVMEEGNFNERWKKRVPEMVVLSVRGPSLFPLFFHSLEFWVSRQNKKGGGRPTGPPTNIIDSRLCHYLPILPWHTIWSGSVEVMLIFSPPLVWCGFGNLHHMPLSSPLFVFKVA